jgi:hypothetical protein
VILDEVNGNDFIDKIDKRWSGAIPATFITVNKRKQTFFDQKKMTQTDLEGVLNSFLSR